MSLTSRQHEYSSSKDSNHLNVISSAASLTSTSSVESLTTCSISVPVAGLQQGPREGRARQLWTRLGLKLGRGSREARVAEEETRSKLMEQFEDMTYEEIAIWVDTKARWTHRGGYI